jgi:uncharacterized protein
MWRLSGHSLTMKTSQQWFGSVQLYAADLDATQRRVEQAGGRIVRPAYSFPGGRRFHFADPDGYELAVWSAT